jgi:RsmE family RNA methyltransferase
MGTGAQEHNGSRRHRTTHRPRFVVNLILLFREDFVSQSRDRVLLQGRRLQHVTNIHRASIGDELRVGVLGGHIGQGRITALESDRFEMQVRLEREPPVPLPATLILALPRPLMLKRVLHTATSMGVKRIALIGARRVERSFWSSRALREESVREQLVLGLEQACDTVLPEVSVHPRFKHFVEDELPAGSAGSLALVAHPGSAAECPARVGRPVTLAVGPEGGFSDFEIETFERAGFEAVHLGERILRVEAAVPALLSRLLC